ncbi:hypothetical protein SY88_06270 [Clostridiales bacterium PH28_bin88]|nr:hypothetical protein SY88_06270 [Clostridiales bacterium PH28_bin88]
MEVLHSITQVSRRHTGAVIALGNFDGVHRGHHTIISRTVSMARELGTKSMVLTFEPHPLQVLKGDEGPKLLTVGRRKAVLLENLGLDILFFCPFTTNLALITPEEFIKTILVAVLRPKSVFVGFNYTFGRGGVGTPELLRVKGRELGFDVTVVPPVLHEGIPISSSTIREALQSGAVSKARDLLGYWPVIEGRVVGGHGRGRQIGFPTANVEVAPEMLLPAEGVYAGRVQAEGQIRTGLINIGRCPTFGSGSTANVEVHLLDFKGNLYGKEIVVELRARLRDERKFMSVNELIAQIRRDIEVALNINEEWW